MIQRLLLLLFIGFSTVSALSVVIIYPVHDHIPELEFIANTGSKAFEAIVPNSVVIKKRYYYPNEQCSVLKDLVHNIVKQSPQVYIFVLRQGKNSGLCTNKWEFHDRLLMVLPHFYGSHAELDFDFVNGKKFFVGTWKELVSMINDEEVNNRTSTNETIPPNSTMFDLIQQGKVDAHKDIMRRRRLTVLVLVLFSGSILAFILLMRNRQYRKQLCNDDAERVIEVCETSA